MAQSNRYTGRASASPRQRLLFGWDYEDERIELAQFAAPGRVLVVANAGEMVAHLAAAGHSVDVVSANRAQLRYARSRTAGGAFETGSAEKIMELGRGLIRAAAPAWSRRAVRGLLAEHSPQRTSNGWKKLDNRRFRSILSTTLAPAGLLSAIVQRDFARVTPPHFTDVVRSRLAEGLARHPTDSNRFAWRLLLGEELPGYRLPSCDPEQIRWIDRDVLGHLEHTPKGYYDGITLSNVVDGADAPYVDDLRSAAIRAIAPGGAIVARTFAATMQPDAAARAARDRAMLWGGIEVLR